MITQVANWVLACDSRREHKARGASPRLATQFQRGARGSGRQLETFTTVARFAGSETFFFAEPGARAPGFMLTPAIAG